jgi:DNA invertase Pin-like site-specific DNA recombinase
MPEEEIYDKSSRGGAGINLQRFRLPLCSCHFNDRLLLGLKGTMSESELHVPKARLRGAILSKAQRGELKMPLPGGPGL